MNYSYFCFVHFPIALLARHIQDQIRPVIIQRFFYRPYRLFLKFQGDPLFYSSREHWTELMLVVALQVLRIFRVIQRLQLASLNLSPP